MSTSISSIPNTTSTDTSSTAASSASGSLTGGVNMGKEDFLLLLTTQLRYQNPLSPEDPKDFVAQLSQFSSLEQLINVNTKLDDYSTTSKSMQTTMQLSQGLDLIGKQVKAQGNAFVVKEGEANKASLILGSNAASVKVSIYDSNSKLVRTLDMGGQSKGEVQISWDGKDSNGTTVADGTYRYQVTATDSNKNTVETASYVTGTVEEVLQDSDTIYLKVNGLLVTLDSILSIDES
ncbi:MAG: FlgD immunoglobulin-like domain containing protein [Syntrophales bacterium]|nr:FlgD immunoglobulin-like domain containing protein [Syntrophales bacterium]